MKYRVRGRAVMVYTYLKLILLFIVVQVSLNAGDSLEDSKEFQRMLAEAHNSNLAKDKARATQRQKEAETAKKEALLEPTVKKIKFINFAGEQVPKESIDYIDIGSARIQKGYIEFFIAYFSRDAGSQVFWRDGTAELNCKAYTYKGKLLGTIKNKKVHSSKQAFYIKGKTQGTLKCNLDFYGKTYSESADIN